MSSGRALVASSGVLVDELMSGGHGRAICDRGTCDGDQGGSDGCGILFYFWEGKECQQPLTVLYQV